MGTITNNQMTRQEETVFHSFENIVDGVDIEYLIKITQTKKKLKIEVGDMVVCGDIYGKFISKTNALYTIEWINRDGLIYEAIFSIPEMLNRIDAKYWEIYKKVEIK